MALFKNSFETGIANGTQLTTTNSDDNGAGQIFSGVTGTNHTFDTSIFMHGTRSMKTTNTGTANTYYEWVGLTGQNTLFALRQYFYISALPTTADEVLCYIRGASGGTTGVSPILLRTNGTIRAQSDAAGGTAIFTTVATFSATTWYRLEVYGQANTTTTGELHLRVYAGDSVTPITNASLDSTTANLGASTIIGSIRWGRGATLGQTNNVYRDDVAFQTASMTPIGPESTAINRLKSGTTTPLLKVGTSAVSKAYAGTTQIWP